MDEKTKRQIGEAVARALGPSGADVLYDPEEFHDPDRTSEGVAELVAQTVMDKISQAEQAAQMG